MKRITASIITGIMIFCLSACGSSNTEKDSSIVSESRNTLMRADRKTVRNHRRRRIHKNPGTDRMKRKTRIPMKNRMQTKTRIQTKIRIPMKTRTQTKVRVQVKARMQAAALQEGLIMTHMGMDSR